MEKLKNGVITKIIKNFGFIRTEENKTIHFWMDNAYGDIAVGQHVVAATWDTPKGETAAITTAVNNAAFCCNYLEFPEIFKVVAFGNHIKIVYDLNKENNFTVVLRPKFWDDEIPSGGETIWVSSRAHKEGDIVSFKNVDYKVHGFKFLYIEETLAEETARKKAEEAEYEKNKKEKEERLLLEKQGKEAELTAEFQKLGLQFPINIQFEYLEEASSQYDDEYVAILTDKNNKTHKVFCTDHYGWSSMAGEFKNCQIENISELPEVLKEVICL